jgi:hypothetical protein
MRKAVLTRASIPQRASLAGMWDFSPGGLKTGTTFNDLSYKGNTATISATPRFTAYGVDLNGTSEYFDCGDVFAVDKTQMSVSWLGKIDAFNVSAGADRATGIVSSFNNFVLGAQKGFLLRAYFNNATGNLNLAFSICDGVAIATVETSPITASTFAALYAGRFVCVTGVFVSGAIMNLYIDGVMVATKTTGVLLKTAPDLTTAVWIGRVGINAGQPYTDGQVRHVAIWDAALTPSDVTAMYKYHRCLS